MPSNPYSSPLIPSKLPMPRRLRQGRTIVVAIIAIILSIHLWEIGWLVAWKMWGNLLFPSIRFVISLALVYAFWRGQNWARFVLAAYCVGILYVNLPLLEHLPKMRAAGDWPSLATVSLLLIGHTSIAILALFFRASTGLIAFRLEEADLKS